VKFFINFVTERAQLYPSGLIGISREQLIAIARAAAEFNQLDAIVR